MQEASYLIGTLRCDDKERIAQVNVKGALLTPCEKCKKQSYITRDMWQLKKSNPKYKICCHKCLEEEAADDKTDVVFAFAQSKEEAETVIKDFEDMLNKYGSFENMLLKFETDLFESVERNHFDQMNCTEEMIPSLCCCAIGRLRIFDKVEDMVIAHHLRSLVQELLLRKRKRLGTGKMFDGYDKKQIIQIIRFLIGLNFAIDEWCDRKEDISAGADDIMDTWHEGFEHWHENVMRIRREQGHDDDV